MGDGAKPGPKASLKAVARVPKHSGGKGPKDTVTAGAQPKGMAMAAHVNPVPKNASGGSSKNVGGWNSRRSGKKK